MRIAVFGSTGRTGQHIVGQALARGHQIKACARTPGKLNIRSPDLELVEGEIVDADRVSRAIAGADAVISALAASENKPSFAVGKGTEFIAQAVKHHGIERLVLPAGAGVGDPNDTPKPTYRFFNLLVRTFSRFVYEDLKRAAGIVRRSDLQWTIVRAPMLTDEEPKGGCEGGLCRAGDGHARHTRRFGQLHAEPARRGHIHSSGTGDQQLGCGDLRD